VKTVTIVGVGKAGGALAIALSRAGYSIEKLAHRNSDLARTIKRKEIPTATLVRLPKVGAISSNIVIVAVPDPEISTVSHALEGVLRISKGQTVLHTSGSLTSGELSNLARLGCETGSIHPLVSISDPFLGADRFQNAYFCVEGSKTSIREARRIIKALGGKSFTIDPSKKGLYHAAAVTSAGHVTAVFDVAIEMLSKCGVTRKEAQNILYPLLSSAVRNLERQSTDVALTGSFARLDIAAFERHLSSFGPLSVSVKDVYFALAERSLDMVERRNGTTGGLTAFRERISIAKRNSK